MTQVPEADASENLLLGTSLSLRVFLEETCRLTEAFDVLWRWRSIGRNAWSGRIGGDGGSSGKREFDSDAIDCDDRHP
jgi:hypothetical protein